MTTQAPLEEAFELLAKYNKTKSDNVRERIVAQLFRRGYIIRPAQMIIVHDEVHSDVLNEGSKEWTLYGRRSGRPVIPPNATWRVALGNEEVNKWVFNRQFREVISCYDVTGIGAIKRQVDGLYTINNGRGDEEKVIVTDIPEDQVDTKLAELGIENADWR